MNKIVPFLLLLCLSVTASAQEVVVVEEQAKSLKFVLEIALPIPVTYDVLNYKVTYTTTDAFGQPDTATGLVSLPEQDEFVLPLVLYNHGTVGARDEVPSVPGVLERLLVAGIAGNSFIALAPDYLGLGDSDGIHPYLHAATEASAGRDMVIAVKKWLDEQGIRQNDQLFITGYSQGGHASMALHRNLEEMPGDDGITVTAAAHLSGPYDIVPPQPLVLGIRNVSPTALSFFMNTIISYDYVYDLYGGVDSFIVEPYLTEVQRFLNEEVDLYEMGLELDTLLRDNDAVVGAIFSDEFVGDVLDEDPALLQAYNDNDVFDWAPAAPTLLYYCNADETVSPLQSLQADSVMRVNGADSLLLEDGGAFTHFACATPAGVRALRFFQGFANVFSVSVGELSNRPDLRMVPNPVQRGDLLRFPDLPGAERNYLVYDQQGRVVLQGSTAADGALRIPASLPKGLMVVRLGLEDGRSIVRRVLVQ